VNSRDRVLAVLNRQPVDRLPIDIWCTPEVLADLRTHFGVEDELELYQAMGVDKIVWVGPKYGGPRRPPSFPGEQVDEWGVGTKAIRAASHSLYNEVSTAPLRGLDGFDGYPWWPDPARYAYAAGIVEARRAHQRFATLGPWVSLFEIYCSMRGLEDALVDVLSEPQLVNAALDRIEAVQTEVLKRWLEAAQGCIDLVFISDDLGSQTGLLISPAAWEQLLQERLQRWCRLIHSYGARVFYHSDGAIAPMIPRLLDAGVDVLNPIQHVCPGMDCQSLKAGFGDRVIFHGGVDNQTVLPFGTPADVRDEVRRCIATLGHDRAGYICCSCHNVQGGTPLANVLAMIDAARDSGGAPGRERP